MEDTNSSEELIRTALKQGGHCILSSTDFAIQKGLDVNQVVGALKSLADESRGVVNLELESQVVVRLTDEGSSYVETGASPEFAFLRKVEQGNGEIPLAEAKRESIAMANALKKPNDWVQIDKKGGADGKGVVRAKKSLVDVVDTVYSQLVYIAESEKACNGKRCAQSDFIAKFSKQALDGLSKRKLVKSADEKWFKVSPGPKFGEEEKQVVADLTSDLLVNDRWKEANFKAYNLSAMGLPQQAGALHPLLKMREEYRRIFFELGFEEMKTDRWVENSFWNFDALFQPQQHPARDMHDTFFLKTPAETSVLPPDFRDRVKTVHEAGGFESIGYQYDWKESEAKKNILRTHTTAISSRYLYDLAQEPEFRPRKFFSIDRVFRNEAVDATHLAEFHQVEGFIVDKNLTIRHLMGIIKMFFEKIGLGDVRFKPAYNPYTEPSMEVFAYHHGLKKEVEVGNSGMFRPEMLRPMGLDGDVTVAAWGLSLERPTMILFGVDDIRELVGYRADVTKVRNTPIARVRI